MDDEAQTHPTPIKAGKQRSRPGITRVRIDDCGSVKLFDNAAARCPHGKAWRESDYDTAPAAAKQLMCEFDTCLAVEHHPHVGEHIVLRVPRSYAARRPITDLIQLTADNGAPLRSGKTVTDVLDEIIAAAVEEWGWTGDCSEEPYGICAAQGVCQYTDSPLPLPKGDPDVVAAHLTSSEMWWIVNAVMSNGDPSAVDSGKA